MTTHRRSRTYLVGIAVTALLAPLAVVATLASPAAAAPGKPHEVYMYKVEKHVDLSGEFPDKYLKQDVSCNAGDIVLDGMWRVDHVDQANPPDTVGDERDVYFTASYSDTANKAKWHFRAHNYADGDAQVKLFVTCIRGKVEQAYGHQHNVVVTRLTTDATHTSLPAGAGNEFDGLYSCSAGQVAVAPGFNLKLGAADTDDYKARLFRSWPTAGFRGWHWAFLVDDSGVDLELYLSCLQVKTTGAGSGPHAHSLLNAWRPNGYAGTQQFLTKVGMQERRINCDDGTDGKYFQDYKAVVGAFWISDPFHSWFLGMDPRPKQRSYTFWWDGSGSSDVYLGALCIRARTGKQIAP